MAASRLLEYLDAEGRSPYGAWFDGLNAPAAAKVAAALYQLTAGNRSNVEGVGSGVFERKMAAAIKKPSKSLHRMLAPRGNPSTENLFSIVSALQKKTGAKLRVTAKAG